MRCRRTPVALLALATLLAGCVLPEESLGTGQPVAIPPAPAALTTVADPRDHGDLRLEWEPTQRYQAYEAALQEDGALQGWIDDMNARLALPRDIPIRHAECGVENSFYDPQEKVVVLCYELLDSIRSVMEDPSLSAQERASAVGDAWLFVALHEIGHALIDAYGLPVTGREEDSVDDLAAVTLIDNGATQAAIDAAAFWGSLGDQQGSAAGQYADEHSMNGQRYYEILCIVYGSDPHAQSWLVDQGYLPAERAPRCPREFEQKDRAWAALLGPWTKASASPSA